MYKFALLHDNKIYSTSHDLITLFFRAAVNLVNDGIFIDPFSLELCYVNESVTDTFIRDGDFLECPN